MRRKRITTLLVAAPTAPTTIMATATAATAAPAIAKADGLYTWENEDH
jgi:hypothetical protein